MNEQTGTTPNGENTVHAVTLLTAAVAIYVAFWRIDWTSPSLFSDGSLWRYIAPVIFVIVVSSVVGSIAAAILTRRD